MQAGPVGFVLAWRLAELRNTGRNFATLSLHSRLVIGIGGPPVLLYGLAIITVTLGHARPVLQAGWRVWLPVFAATNTALGAIVAAIIAARCTARMAQPWIVCLPVSGADPDRLARMDTALPLAPTLVLLAAVQATDAMVAGFRAPGSLCLLALAALATGAGPAAWRGRAPRARPLLPARQVGSHPKSDRHILLDPIDKPGISGLVRWCSSHVLSGRLRTLGAGLLAMAAITTTAIITQGWVSMLPASGALHGHLAFVLFMRTAPAASPALRSLPVSYARMLAHAARLPMLVSLTLAAPLIIAGSGGGRVALAALGLLIGFNLVYAIYALYYKGREALAVIAYALTIAAGFYNWPKFGLSEVAALLVIVGLMIRRGTADLPGPRRRRP